MGKNLLSVIIVIFFAAIAGFSLLHKGLPPTHDGEYHVVRFFLFNEALTDGNLYPRWAAHLNNDFGVPLFNFVYPLPNYIAAFFHVFGVSFIDSFKLEMFSATLVGGVFFYLWAKEFWGRLGGIVSSVFYTFSPYHFVDIYIRGSVGEVIALAFFPAFLWSFTKFVKTKQKVFLAFSSLFFALIIFSHNILALMFFIFSLSYMVFLISTEKNKKNLILNVCYLMLLGLGLSAIFWLPAIYETKFVTGLQIFDINAHFPDLYQLLIPSWGSGFSAAGLRDVLSFQIGLANLIVIFLSFLIVIWQIKKRNKKSIFTIFFLVWFVLNFYLMLNISSWVWKTIPFMNYIQFPWRLLSLEILFASFLAGSIFSLQIKNKLIAVLLATLLVFTAFIFGIGYAKPAYYLYRDDNYYVSHPNFISGTNSPGNVFNTIFMKTIPDKEKDKALFLKGDGEITVTDRKSNSYVLKAISDKNAQIIMNLTYFPGWNVYVNGKQVKVEPTENGRFRFDLPPGKNSIKVIFENTLIRNFSTFAFLISLILILILFMKNKSVRI